MKKLYRIMQSDGSFIMSPVKGRFAGWNGGRKDRKIFGRLDCKSGMKMKEENRVFFHTWEDAIAAGFRPCKKCKPAPDDTYE